MTHLKFKTRYNQIIEEIWQNLLQTSKVSTNTTQG